MRRPKSKQVHLRFLDKWPNQALELWDVSLTLSRWRLLHGSSAKCYVMIFVAGHYAADSAPSILRQPPFFSAYILLTVSVLILKYVSFTNKDCTTVSDSNLRDNHLSKENYIYTRSPCPHVF